MVFGAWCDRQYGFVYDAIRAHHGLAWFPVLDSERNIHWESNPSYLSSSLSIRGSRAYPELGLDPNTPMYEQFAADPDSVQWVSQPAQRRRIVARPSKCKFVYRIQFLTNQSASPSRCSSFSNETPFVSG